MKHSFIRFYLGALFALISIALGLEGLFSASIKQEEPLIEANWIFCALTESSVCPAMANAKKQILHQNEIFLPESLRQELASGQVRWLENHDGFATLIAKRDASHYVLFGPLPVNASQDLLPVYLYLSFFGGLALVLLLLLWPIFRDLELVRDAITQYGPERRGFQNTLKRNSRIYPLAAAIEQLLAQIRQLLNSQRDMMHFIAHDIRTPLARMRFALAILPKDEDNLHQDLQDNVLEMERIVTEYLRYAQEQSEQPVLQLRAVSSHAFFNERVTSFRHQCADLDIQCELDKADYFFADPFSLDRALDNLLQNARRFAHRQIIVSLRSAHGICQLCVEDDGPGIPMQARQSYGKPFANNKRIRGEREKGFGLGLYIVMRMAMLHRGHLKLRTSNRLGGAKFVLSWPNRS